MNIEGSICRLRALEPSDLEVMYGWENDVDLWQMNGATAPFSRHQLSSLIAEQQYDIYATRQLRLVVETEIDGQSRAVGAVDLFEFNPQNRRAGVGIIISAEYQRRGYALDALRCIENYAREVLMLHQLWCSVAANNTPSLRLFDKAGYRQCGERRDWILTTDGALSEILMQKIL
ncbi:MAG: GNAT family N-acetyltransferase [Alistipes sp.]|nr:GNAT family N-acetyltransferase [Alistipes sp.]